MNWFSKASRRKPGRNWLLQKLGYSWLASPVRRFAQMAFFVVFLTLFFYVAFPYGVTDFAQERSRKELVDLELFLMLDPLVSITTAIAAKTWVWALYLAGGMIGLGLILPRAFCGFICPMGTLIDLFDWGINKRIKFLAVRRAGWWRHLRFYILAGVLAAALGGVIFTGYVAPIPVLTRGFVYLISPVQQGVVRGWGHVVPLQGTQLLSIGLFGVVLLLGMLRPRFWCRHLCPSGALFSLANVFRLTHRHVKPQCVKCGKCAKVCSFDAINDDFSTKGPNCTFCQTCGGVCPVEAIHFDSRYASVASKAVSLPQIESGGPAVNLSRRGFLIGAAVGTVSGGLAAKGLRLTPASALPAVVRPPGSVAEDLFVSRCVRCDECLRVCPSGILQPASLEQGLNRIWTPVADANIAGCDPTCNNCGHACPTGAIAPLTIEQKKENPMGLSWVDAELCLQIKGQNHCVTANGESLICRDACDGIYSAIVTQGEGHITPSVMPDICVGCGLCQAECYRVNVLEKKLLRKAAIRVQPLANRTTPATAPALTQPTTAPETAPEETSPQG